LRALVLNFAMQAGPPLAAREDARNVFINI
jgi:hypothetical protein